MRRDCSLKLVKWLSLGFGLMDAFTGLGLIFAPLLTLHLMGIEGGEGPLSMLRFVGAFVFGTGSLYLWGLFWVKREGSFVPLRYAWMATSWIRICVGLVTGFLIGSGALSTGWITVPLADLIIAGFQICWIRCKQFPSDG